MKSHRTDSVSLFFGLAFLMIALGYLAKVYLNLNLPSMGWFIAGGLVFLGVVGAVTALVPSRQAAPQPVSQPADLEPERQELDQRQEFERQEDADAEQAR